MIRDLLKKVFGAGSNEPDEAGESRDMDEVRGDAQDKANALNPGHSERAGSIGAFHP
jgi:hypothetical protein